MLPSSKYSKHKSENNFNLHTRPLSLSRENCPKASNYKHNYLKNQNSQRHPFFGRKPEFLAYFKNRERFGQVGKNRKSAQKSSDNHRTSNPNISRTKTAKNIQFFVCWKAWIFPLFCCKDMVRSGSDLVKKQLDLPGSGKNIRAHPYKLLYAMI